MTFFSSDYKLTLIGPLFRNNPETTYSQVRPRQTHSKWSPFHFLLFQGNLQNRTCLKDPLWIFLALCDFFFENFQMSPKGFLIFRVFWYFASECMLINLKGSPLLHFLSLCNIFRKKKFQVFFQKNVLRFLSLRHSADFRRSGLVFSSDHRPHIDQTTF